MTGRLDGYFKDRVKDMAFVELALGALGGLLDGVPVPLDAKDVRDSAEKGLDAGRIAKNMVKVIGCDPSFPYAHSYVGFIRTAFDEKLISMICSDGLGALVDGKAKDACVFFRAALVLDPKSADAMYGYARACRDVYADSEDDTEIGNFKAESIEYFEKLTMEHPEVAEGHYYLGYGYMNMGLYVKAEIAFRDFLERSPEGEEATEVRERLAQLRDPVAIEKGCNEVIAGRYENGIEALEKYLGTGAKTWWPLHYYLGVAYMMTGDDDQAIERFRNVLRLNASHIESMEELAGIYSRLGEKELEEKYRRKAALVKAGAEAR